jgi:cytoskeletal protein RodZ
MDLITVRQKKGVSLAEIARDTRIRVYYLAAIEQGDFKELPGGVYSTSYIRQYARAIDFDEGELIERYYKATGIAPEPEAPPPAPKRLLDLFLKPLSRVWS